VYSTRVSNDWHCLSVANATEAFRELRQQLFFSIFMGLAVIAIVVFILIRSNKRRARFAQLSVHVVESLAAAIDAKDKYTSGHSGRVAEYAREIGEHLGYSRVKQNEIYMMGLLHDVGKIGIPDSVINKPGRLTEEEFETIKQHPETGVSILAKTTEEMPRMTIGVHWHHERYDGSGYPLNLSGESIDRFARLTAISDVYDAMTAARCYRGPLCPFRVIEIFEEDGFEKYDAEFVLTFLSNVGATYVRNACRLSDGREAEIIMLNKEKLSRPVVQCGYDYIDLMKHPELTIEELL
jgi:HD-GYP domain-containing protein (c-di-GMP phosphodiesterase class II)